MRSSGIEKGSSESHNLGEPSCRRNLINVPIWNTDAMSVVLMVERQNIQIPIYFISGALQGVELNYPMVEKVVLALVCVARRLCRYFQAHQIEVLATQPLKSILLKLEKSGQLIKWDINLGEHDIEYHPLTIIKGKSMADFLTERKNAM